MEGQNSPRNDVSKKGGVCVMIGDQ
jgi:hypothetical protein